MRKYLLHMGDPWHVHKRRQAGGRKEGREEGMKEMEGGREGRKEGKKEGSGILEVVFVFLFAWEVRGAIV